MKEKYQKRYRSLRNNIKAHSEKSQLPNEQKLEEETFEINEHICRRDIENLYSI